MNSLPTLGESVSELSHFIPELSHFAEVKRLPEDVKKSWLKSTFKYIKNIFNKHNFIMNDPDNGDPVTPCIYVYKSKV